MPNQVTPFSLSDVELLDGPFKHAEELNITSLLTYDPDPLLAQLEAQVGNAWNDADAHRRLLERASVLGRFIEVASFYRVATKDPARHEVATAQLRRIEAMALAVMMARERTPPKTGTPRRYLGLLVVLILAGLALAGLIYALAASNNKPRPSRVPPPPAGRMIR